MSKLSIDEFYEALRQIAEEIKKSGNNK